MTRSLSDIIIDPEFRDFLPPLPDEDRVRLMQSVLRDGFRDPLVIWMNHGTLIDGHHRLVIWQTAGDADEDKAPDVVEMKFADKDAVKKWIITNQLARRNLTDAQRIKIAEKLRPAIAAKAKEQQGTRNDLCLNSDKGSKPIDTTAEIAKAAGVSKDSVRKVEAVRATGDVALNEAMDTNYFSIHKAAQLAKLPAAQRNVETSSSTATPPKRMTKPIMNEDVGKFSTKIWCEAENLVKRIRKTSIGAKQALPGLVNTLRSASLKLSELADEIEAKIGEG